MSTCFLPCTTTNTDSIQWSSSRKLAAKLRHFAVLTLAMIAILSCSTAVSVTAADRMQYHQQGLRDAPSHVSYRFGYDSGDRENPQSRHEVSYEPGYVTGAYSFIDANNKLQYVKYEAHPEHGFRIVDQWTQDAAAASGADGSPLESDGQSSSSSSYNNKEDSHNHPNGGRTTFSSSSHRD